MDNYYNKQILARKRGKHVLVDEIVSDKINIISKVIYDNAIKSMLESNKWISNHKYTIINTPSYTLYDAPTILINFMDKWPFVKVKVDLTPWWADYQFNKLVPNEKIKKLREKYANWECTYKNYVWNFCEIHDKMSDKETKITLKLLDEINDETIIIPNSEKMNTIYSGDTFVQLYKDNV